MCFELGVDVDDMMRSFLHVTELVSHLETRGGWGRHGRTRKTTVIRSHFIILHAVSVMKMNRYLRS